MQMSMGLGPDRINPGLNSNQVTGGKGQRKRKTWLGGMTVWILSFCNSQLCDVLFSKLMRKLVNVGRRGGNISKYLYNGRGLCVRSWIKVLSELFLTLDLERASALAQLSAIFCAWAPLAAWVMYLKMFARFLYWSRRSLLRIMPVLPTSESQHVTPCSVTAHWCNEWTIPDGLQAAILRGKHR